MQAYLNAYKHSASNVSLKKSMRVCIQTALVGCRLILAVQLTALLLGVAALAALCMQDVEILFYAVASVLAAWTAHGLVRRVVRFLNERDAKRYGAAPLS